MCRFLCAFFVLFFSLSPGEKEGKTKKKKRTKVRCDGCIDVRVLEGEIFIHYTEVWWWYFSLPLLCVTIQCALLEDADDNSSKHAGMNSVDTYRDILFLSGLHIRGLFCREAWWAALFLFSKKKKKKLCFSIFSPSDHGNCSLKKAIVSCIEK
jgi:hypothetical protein